MEMGVSEFQEFPKISRFYEQNVVVTEKIDGTNGLIWISDDRQEIKAGSRNRWITIEDDNYRFAAWVHHNKDELLNLLGPGYHYGEWWGKGIQHGYGMKRKVFSLFNSKRWRGLHSADMICDCVPILYDGLITPEIIDQYSKPLPSSKASEKYGVQCLKPEGVMMYFTKANIYFKCPIKKGGKG
jgi:hypothetical protein